MSNLKIIVGHRRPSFTPWAGHRFATFTPEQEDDLALPAWGEDVRELYDRTLGEYFYLFALRRALADHAPYRTITVSQYRRFVTVTPIGAPAANQINVNVVTPEVASRVETGRLVREKSNGWLVPMGFETSILAYYDRFHILRDYYRFLADSFDAGALSREEILEATTSRVFIASSSIGVFPGGTLMEFLTKMERCVEAFVAGGYVSRDGYQRRVMGFCLERLQSVLILRALRRQSVDYVDVSGRQTVVSGTDRVLETR